MRNPFRLPLLVFVFLFLTAGVHAQTLGPYEGEVGVASQADADRIAALPDALAQVLLRQGGAAAVAAASGVDASTLLQQYRYRQEMTSLDGQAHLRLYLIARFDQQAVQRLLASAGVATLPAQRPQPVLWLAIDDGSGARIVSQDAAAAVLPLSTRATQRGLNLRLPRYDAQDSAIVIARDLAGAETYAVDTATARYGGPALLGWMRRDADGWVVDWRLREGGGEIGRWQNRDPQAAVVLAAGADGAADALAQRYAQRVASGPAGRYSIVVEGLTSASDYARVMGMLGRQPIVRAVAPTRVAGTRLELDLELSAGVDGLAQLLRGSGLEPVFVGDQKTSSEFALGER